MSLVSNAKRSCILGNILFKAAVKETHGKAMKLAWFMAKNWETHDMALMLAFCRKVVEGDRDGANRIYRLSIDRGIGACFRAAVNLLRV